MSKEDAIEVEASSGREAEPSEAGSPEILSEAKDLPGHRTQGVNEQRRRD
jgi:hypothetical protein